MAYRVKASRHKEEFPLMSICIGCHQKLWPRFRVGFPVSNRLIKRISHSNARQLGLNISLDVVKLTAKISHHSR